MDLKDKKTKITFYAGMKTIGGTYIEVRYNDDRIIFDCGSIFDPKLGDNLSFQDILENELAPKIDGIYDKRLYKTEVENTLNTAVLVSHIHLDHTKMINYIDNDIPVYTSKDTKILLESLNINRNFIYDNSLNQKPTRDIIGINYDQSIQIGKIKVKFVRVDHDGYGACGFIINTPDMKISYTGDIRLHGYLSKETKKFINEAKNSDILIIEGVSVSFKDFNETLEDGEIYSEEDLIKKFNYIVDSNNDKQISFNYYIANIERIKNIISSSSRKVVLNELNAYVLYKVTGVKSYYYSETDNIYNLDNAYKISYEDLLEDSKNYLWQFNKKDKENISKLKKGGVYIHCDSSPLGEFDPEYLPFIDKFKKNEIDFYLVKCSGHAHPNDLLYIINEIKPEKLVPIHSFRPEMLYNDYGQTILPEKNEII